MDYEKDLILRACTTIMEPSVARLAYTLTLIFLVLALIALPFNINIAVNLAIDLVVIIMLVAFLIYIVISVRRSQ